jgi:hypothetical protein
MVVNTHRKLTWVELAFYHGNGYVVISHVFPVEELSGIDREIDRIQEQDGGVFIAILAG